MHPLCCRPLYVKGKLQGAPPPLPPQVGGGAGWQLPQSWRAAVPKPPQLSCVGCKYRPAGHSVQKLEPAPRHVLQLASQWNVCSGQQPEQG